MADFVDFGRAAADYARFRQGFPPDFLGRLSPLGVGHPGQRVVDIGTGTGLFARALAARGCSVIGVDPSAAMLAEARQIASPPVQYVQGGAEHTSLPAASCDVVAAATCWHWFDRPAAAAEARR
ncbi:MAG TPA: class I SAM-dependent methyltransferase, partial [Acetobacteraceae bacterium]|nr:class I SAM-dependent methyltransferase [Acetobacteraceae bacterium]